MSTARRIVRQRRVAILVADAVGYSRLMALDDRATLLALDIAREILRDRVVAQGVRIVDLAGDSSSESSILLLLH